MADNGVPPDSPQSTRSPNRRRPDAEYDRVRVHCRIRPVLGQPGPRSHLHFQTGGSSSSTANKFARSNRSSTRSSASEAGSSSSGGAADPNTNKQDSITCKTKTYFFDSVLAPEITNRDLFDHVAQPVCDSVLAGYNGTILAYGQTGTGKTHTLFSNPDGVVPACVHTLFTNSNKDESITYLSVVELYMELVQDLLAGSADGFTAGTAYGAGSGGASGSASLGLPLSSSEVRIREDPRDGIILENCEQLRVHSAEACMRLIRDAEHRRAEAATMVNKNSSRSHAVVILKRELQTGGSCVLSRFHIVDLAGSERVKKTNAWGLRLGEARRINLSLSALGNCIAALTDVSCTHIPFRDSKLTRLLQDSLGGTAKTALIVTVSPLDRDVEETQSTLEFGSRAMRVQNRPKIHQITDYRSLAMRLQMELDRKEDELSKLLLKVSSSGGPRSIANSPGVTSKAPSAGARSGSKSSSTPGGMDSTTTGPKPCCQQALAQVEAEFARYLEEFEQQAAETDSELLKLRTQVRDLSEREREVRHGYEDAEGKCVDLETQLQEREDILLRISSLADAAAGAHDASLNTSTSTGFKFAELDAKLDLAAIVDRVTQLSEFKKEADAKIDTLTRRERVAQQKLQDVQKKGVAVLRNTKTVDSAVNTSLEFSGYADMDNTPAQFLRVDVDKAGGRNRRYNQLEDSTNLQKLRSENETLRVSLSESAGRLKSQEQTLQAEAVALRAEIRELQTEREEYVRKWKEERKSRAELQEELHEKDMQARSATRELEQAREMREQLQNELEAAHSLHEGEKVAITDKYRSEADQRCALAERKVLEKHQAMEVYEKNIQRQLAELEQSYETRHAEYEKRFQRERESLLQHQENLQAEYSKHVHEAQEKLLAREKELQNSHSELLLQNEKQLREDLQLQYDRTLATREAEHREQLSAALQAERVEQARHWQTEVDAAERRAREAVEVAQKRFSDVELPERVKAERTRLQHEADRDRDRFEVEIRTELKKTSDEALQWALEKRDKEWEKRQEQLRQDLAGDLERELAASQAVLEKQFEKQRLEQLAVKADECEARLRKAGEAHAVELAESRGVLESEKATALAQLRTDYEKREADLRERFLMPLQEEQSATESRLQTALGEKSLTETQLQVVREEKDAVTREKDALQRELDQVRGQLANQSSTAETQSRQLQDELDTVRGFNEERQGELLKLQQKLAEREEQLTTFQTEQDAKLRALQDELAEQALVHEEMENDLQSHTQKQKTLLDYCQAHGLECSSLDDVAAELQRLANVDQMLQDSEAMVATLQELQTVQLDKIQALSSVQEEKSTLEQEALLAREQQQEVELSQLREEVQHVREELAVEREGRAHDMSVALEEHDANVSKLEEKQRAETAELATVVRDAVKAFRREIMPGRSSSFNNSEEVKLDAVDATSDVPALLRELQVSYSWRCEDLEKQLARALSASEEDKADLAKRIAALEAEAKKAAEENVASLYEREKELTEERNRIVTDLKMECAREGKERDAYWENELATLRNEMTDLAGLDKTTLEAQHAADLERVRKEHVGEVNRMEETHRVTVEELRSALTATRAGDAEEISALKLDHATVLREKEESHAEAVAELKRDLDEKVAKLNEDIAAAQARSEQEKAELIAKHANEKLCFEQQALEEKEKVESEWKRCLEEETACVRLALRAELQADTEDILRREVEHERDALQLEHDKAVSLLRTQLEEVKAKQENEYAQVQQSLAQEREQGEILSAERGRVLDELANALEDNKRLMDKLDEQSQELVSAKEGDEAARAALAEAHRLALDKLEQQRAAESATATKDALDAQKKLGDTTTMLNELREKYSLELRQKKQDRVDAESRVDEAQRRTAVAEAELKTAKDSLQVLSQEKLALQETTQKDEVSLLQLRTELLQVQNEKQQQLQLQLEEQDQEHGRLRDELAVREQNLADVRQELEVRQEECDKLVAQLEKENAELLQNSTKVFSEQKEELLQREAAFDRAIEEKTTLISDLEEEIEAREQEFSRSKADLAQMEEKRVADRAEVSEKLLILEDRVAELETELERREQALAKQKALHETASSTLLAEKQTAIDLLEKRNANLRTEIQKLQSSADMKEKELDDAAEELGIARSALEKREKLDKGKFDELQTGLADALEQVVTLQENEQTLELKLATRLEELELLQTHFSQKRREIDLLDRENLALKSEIDTLKSYNSDLAHEKLSAEKRCTETKLDTLNRSEAELLVLREQRDHLQARADKAELDLGLEKKAKTLIETSKDAEVAALKTELSCVRTSLQEAKSEVSKKEQLLWEYRKRLKKSACALDAVSEQNEQKSQEVAKKQEEDEQRWRSQVQEVADLLEAERAQWKGKERGHAEQVETLELQLSEAHEHRRQREEELTGLKTELRTARHEKASVEKMLRQTKARLRTDSIFKSLSPERIHPKERYSNLHPAEESSITSILDRSYATLEQPSHSSSRAPASSGFIPDGSKTKSAASNKPAAPAPLTLSEMLAKSPTPLRRRRADVAERDHYDQELTSADQGIGTAGAVDQSFVSRTSSKYRVARSISPRVENDRVLASTSSANNRVAKTRAKELGHREVQSQKGIQIADLVAAASKSQNISGLEDLQALYKHLDAEEVDKALHGTLTAIDNSYAASFAADQTPSKSAYELEKAVKRLKSALRK